MSSSGKAQVTISARGHAKSAEEDEEKEGRTLSELEVHVIKEWYDKKDKELVETRGEAYITERNLSAAARQYHNDSMNAHAKTHEGLHDVKKSNADEHAKTHVDFFESSYWYWLITVSIYDRISPVPHPPRRGWYGFRPPSVVVVWCAVAWWGFSLIWGFCRHGFDLSTLS